MAHYPCNMPYCKRCDNNGGGYCDYDLDAEAEALNVEVTDICNELGCIYFDPVEDADYENDEEVE